MIDKNSLAEFLERHRDRPFDWVNWNCCHFAAEWISEATSVDHRDAFPTYTNEAEAREVMQAHGGLIQLVSSLLTPIHVSRAKKGDLVLCNEEHASSMGICIGVYTAHVGEHGLIYLPTLAGIAAWSAE